MTRIARAVLLSVAVVLVSVSPPSSAAAEFASHVHSARCRPPRNARRISPPRARAEASERSAAATLRRSDARLVRSIAPGERVAPLLEELAQLTYSSGGVEHAIISLRDGDRLIVRGAEDGISFGSFRIALRRVLVHTHPMPTGPSAADFGMLEALGQRSSWVYELFGGGLSRFRLR